MGVLVSAIRKELADDTDTKKSVDDALIGMKTAADKSMHIFYSDIEAGKDSKLIPISKVVGKFEFFQCKVSSDPETLKKNIKKLIGNLAGGNWSDAIADGACDIIGMLLGSSAGGIQEQSSYCVSIDPLGGIWRLDQYYQSYNYESKSFVTHIQNYVACCVVKSSIDLTAVNDETLRVIVNDAFPTLSNSGRVKLYVQLATAILSVPPTEAQIRALEALAKFWDENKMVPSSSFPASPPLITAGSKWVSVWSSTITTAAIGDAVIGRLANNLIAAGYSVTSTFDAETKRFRFEMRPTDKPTADAKGFSCEQAEKDLQDAIKDDEEAKDANFELKEATCVIKGKEVARGSAEFSAVV